MKINLSQTPANARRLGDLLVIELIFCCSGLAGDDDDDFGEFDNTEEDTNADKVGSWLQFEILILSLFTLTLWLILL